MKQKISISIEEETISIIENILKEGQFRSKSHILEYSLNQFLKENLEISQLNPQFKIK